MTPTVTVLNGRLHDGTISTTIEHDDVGPYVDIALGSGEYELVPVGSDPLTLTITKENCDRCVGVGEVPYPITATRSTPLDSNTCPKCGGSGKQWPDETLRIMAGGFIRGPGETAGENARDMLDALMEASSDDEQEAERVMDALATDSWSEDIESAMSDPLTCPNCNGTGKVIVDAFLGYVRESAECPSCVGGVPKAAIEALADIEHEQWAHWTAYMLDNLTGDNIARWKRQIDTMYVNLTESEKDSDRKWAVRVVRAIKETTT